jgi:hypothetical protein
VRWLLAVVPQRWQFASSLTSWSSWWPVIQLHVVYTGRFSASRRVTFNSASASYISSTLVGSPFFLAVINVSACRHSLMYVSLLHISLHFMLQRNITLVFVCCALSWLIFRLLICWAFSIFISTAFKANWWETWIGIVMFFLFVW